MKIRLNNRKIGDGEPVFIVAELSANHLKDFNLAKKIIKAAKRSGANAIKLQAYKPETMTVDCGNKYFKIRHPQWGGQTLYELYKNACTPWVWFKRLKKISDDLGILFFSTAFDKTSLDFLEELNVPMHKIASFELVDLPLIECAAKTGKPLILSTGMACLAEIKEAVDTARNAGAKELILLKCVSSYPAKPEEMNLKTIPDLQRRFRCPVGLSDHSLGIGVSITAVSLGACIIEKHFALSRKVKTPDSFFSLEPNELKMLVENIRIAERSMGEVRYGLTQEEKKSRIFRRSIFVIRDIKKGEVFTEEKINSIRPSCGLKPKYLKRALGKKAKIDIKRGTPLVWDMISNSKG